MRPSRPVPSISLAAIECSSSSRRTAGLNGWRAPRASETAGVPAGVSVTADDTVYSRPVDSPPRLKRASTSSGFTSALTCLSTSIKVPSAGAGISTVTLSVSSSTRGSSLTTVSPTSLHHLNTVARVPSSLGGTNTSARWGILDFGQSFDCQRNSLDVRQDCLDQHRAMGTGDIRHGEPFDRRVEVEERFFGDHGRNFRAEAGGHGVFMNDQAAAG